MDGIADERIVRLKLLAGTRAFSLEEMGSLAMSCSCGEPKQWNLPCEHVWAVLLNDCSSKRFEKRFEKRLNPLRYIPNYHSSLAFRETYSRQIIPLLTNNLEETEFNLVVEVVYLSKFPIKALRIMAGFPKKQVSYYLPRYKCRKSSWT
ncbi:hypothetical protein L202_03210 [Cryptococcus amylolentus CBS 6039]|uniref:SWIM-type domain-containing protein n=1 Tax=Cryptococcus amylolentus CBS 6039 TaxID=1295533 RepID=A0A1E3HZE9_9TREE|nr:hypothetical protein L202_03210 [Cryptococcus amylolentus CBS 6039]ODN81116.1 hypothetical protein L202_03210 [Cryptococcus amylolentus CBS 6039]